MPDVQLHKFSIPKGTVLFADFRKKPLGKFFGTRKMTENSIPYITIKQLTMVSLDEKKRKELSRHLAIKLSKNMPSVGSFICELDRGLDGYATNEMKSDSVIYLCSLENKVAVVKKASFIQRPVREPNGRPQTASNFTYTAGLNGLNDISGLKSANPTPISSRRSSTRRSASRRSSRSNSNSKSRSRRSSTSISGFY